MGKKQGDKILANDGDGLCLRGSFLQCSCGVSWYFPLRCLKKKTTTGTTRAIKTAKTTMTIAGTVIVDGAASGEIIGESRHSALKRLFATNLSMQMEVLYVLDTSASCALTSSRDKRFSTLTSQQPRSLMSFWHAPVSTIKRKEHAISLWFLGNLAGAPNEG